MNTIGLLSSWLIISTVPVTGNDDKDTYHNNLCRQLTSDINIKEIKDLRLHKATHCACFEQQIQLNNLFERLENKCYREWMYNHGTKQLCCYGNNGHLLVGAPGGGYPVMTSEKINTSQIHESCCREGGHYNRELCEHFYSIFPSDNCSSYHIPHSVMSWGDPSIQTLDGYTYDFNGHGEYIFLNTSDVEVQVRLDYVNPPNVDATMFTEIVIFVNKSYPVIEIHYKKDSHDIEVYQNGQFLCNASRTTLSGSPYPCKIPPDQRCLILSGHGMVALAGCGLKNVANHIIFSTWDFMSIQIYPLRSINGSVGGLAGKQDGGKLLCRDGSSVEINGTAPEIFNCSETWRLKNEAESHFSYTLTGGNFTVYNQFSKPRFLEELVDNLTALFENSSPENISLYNNTCRNYWDGTSNKQCLLTIARTDNYDLGVEIIKTANETRRHYNLLHNKPPKFNDSTPSVITVSYKQNKTWTLDLKSFVWDNEILVFSVDTELPQDEYNFSDGLFIWTIGIGLRYQNSSKLIFVATDEFHTTSTHEVKIRYCGCEEPSECDFNSTNPKSTDQMFIAACSCKDYYSGPFCTIYADPCKSNNCYNQSLCNANRSRPLGKSDWPCAECPEGFRGGLILDTQHCNDVNECLDEYLGHKKCSQPKNCNNTIGSFLCFCDKGFTLDDDRVTCNDIDECVSSPCQGNRICTNTDGNYTCDCAQGFVSKNSDCVKNDVYRFVGEIDLEVSPFTTNINYTDIEKWNTSLALKLFEVLCNTVVEIYSLSINTSLSTNDAHQAPLLHAQFIVHWTNNSYESMRSYLTSCLKQSLAKPFSLQGLDIQLEYKTFMVFQPNIFGLCNVAEQTDCDMSTADCVNKLDLKGFECRCKSGYVVPRSSNINTQYCIDTNECNWEQISELCLKGSCTNTVGSWNCNCPDPHYPTTRNLSTSNTTKYRCVGDFIYTGRMELFWMNQVVNKSQIEHLFNGTISDLFRTSTTAAVDKYPMSDIFINIEILAINITHIYDLGSSINVTYLIHMGEKTNSSNLKTIQEILFGKKKNIGDKDIIIIQAYLIYEESEYNLCNNNEKIKCDKETTYCHVDEGLYSCPCKPGYTNTSDRFTCQDIDECDLNGKATCTGGGTCKNVPGNWTCDCLTGFEPIYNDDKNVTCQDIDECLHNDSYICRGGSCNNTFAGWQCDCPPGYNTDELKHGFIYTCTDIDECAAGECLGGTCINTNGSFECLCQPGFTNISHGEHQLCTDIDECTSGQGTCHGGGTCNNTPGNWTCDCQTGFNPTFYDGTNIQCEDIDECLHNDSYICRGGSCNNTFGGWQCNCPPGYNTDELKHGFIYMCTDIDECDNHALSFCSNGGRCINIPGSWTCYCQDGYEAHANNNTFVNCKEQTTEPPPDLNKTILCFACAETYSPSFCETIKTCEMDELCFVEKISSSEGSIHFKSGCRKREICQHHQYNTGSGCFECCNGSFCNSRGCGDTGYPAREKRGPVCLDCARVNHPHNCDQIRLCSSDQMCFVDELTWGDTSLFHLGCRNNHQCAADGLMIKRSLPVCSACCQDDFCNVKCQNQDTTELLIG